MQSVSDKTGQIRSDDILAAVTTRNEMDRLPHFLDHYRHMGVAHFLFVDNNSTDGTAEFLAKQPDVSLWSTTHSYKASRFGMDWLAYLQRTYAHGHWCVTVDADELLIYPHSDSRSLRDLTGWLDRNNTPFFAAMMLDMHPKGPLGAPVQGDTPIEALPWFSADHDWEWKPRYRNMSIRGGPRKRLLFAENPDFAPHLNKTPLIRWSRSYVYASSMHLALPRFLNAGFDRRNNLPSGALLHTKFLPNIVEKSTEEKQRREHFTYSERYDDYYDELASGVKLWDPVYSHRYEGWEQLEELGLITRGGWR